jgi:hypothetical protein
VLIPTFSGEVIPHNQLRALASGTSGGANGLTVMAPPSEVHINDMRGRDAPPIQVQNKTGVDGRQIAVVTVRAGLSEMERSGELSGFLQRGYGLRQRPR